MKKALLLLASAALLFAGCAKEQIAASVDGGESVEVTVSAQLQNAEQTKASWDNDGNGAKVDHWIMEVYDAQDKLFDRQEKTDQSGLTNTFTVVLVKNQSYKFAFWADTKDSYNTADLREVKTVSTVAGLDSRDAFFANVDYTSSKSETITAKLYRPFAQINVVTLDLKKIYDQMIAAKTISEGDGGNIDEFTKFEPKELKLSCETYNQFNVLDGTVSDPQDKDLTLASCYADFSAHAEKTTIFMDYLFADGNELKDLTFTFKSNEVAIDYDFTNIPLQRNYRTNISGNLLSNDATWNVEIIPIWTGETDVPYVAAGSIEAANKALKEGVANIQIENPEDFNNHVVFPEEAEGKDITITITGAAGKTIYFENDAATKAVGTTEGPSKLTIVSDVQNLNVNCLNTALTINKMAGESDFPVVKAKSLSISGVEGAVLKTGANGKSLSCESSLKNVEIKTDSANGGTDGALNVNKSSSFDNVKFTGAAKYILVLSGQDTQMDVTNCEFANEGNGRAIMVWGGSPAINIDDCTFDNTYPFNVDGGTPVFTVTNSVLNGWTSYTGTATVSFEGCSFGKSTSGYAFCRPYSSTTFTECDFSSDFKLDFGVTGITFTMNDCTVGGSSPVTKSILNIGDLQCEGILIINGATVYPAYTTDENGNFHVATKDGLFTIAADINASLASFYGKTIFIEKDIDLENDAWTPIQGSQSGDYAITFNGQNHKISNVAISDIPEEGGAGFFGHWAGTITNLELDAVKIENTINWSGALCGYFSTGTISNVTVSNVVISNLNENKCKRNGGLCGFVNTSTDFSNVALCGVAITGTEQLGGFIGSLQADGPATYNFTDCSVSDVSIYKVGTNSVTSFGTKTGGHAAAATISGDITVSGTNTLPEGSPEDGWGANSL